MLFRGAAACRDSLAWPQRFLTGYLCGLIVWTRCATSTERGITTLSWRHGAKTRFDQIALFLMLCHLLTPHKLPAAMLSVLAMAAVLMLIERPG